VSVRFSTVSPPIWGNRNMDQLDEESKLALTEVNFKQLKNIVPCPK
jgi:hypothetical protein